MKWKKNTRAIFKLGKVCKITYNSNYQRNLKKEILKVPIKLLRLKRTQLCSREKAFLKIK